jgi:hypothetical protein
MDQVIQQSLSLPHKEKKDYQKGKEWSMGQRHEIFFRKLSEIFVSQGAPSVVVTGGKFEIYHRYRCTSFQIFALSTGVTYILEESL